MDKRYQIDLYNFSWIEELIIAGSSKPFHPKQFQFLNNHGIKILINLTEDPYTDTSGHFTIYHIPIPDFSTPTDEQIEEFLNICNKHETQKDPILVHCIAGCGRTGTLMAIWLLSRDKAFSGTEAIKQIRKLRPCSIETHDQEEIVNKFSRNKLAK